MEALRQMERITAKALRDGTVREIPAEQLVPGDVVILEGGDVPGADLRLIEASRVQVNESALTGESTSVGKQVEPLASDIPLPERKNMLFKGTAMTAGSCKGVVTATGMATEIGRISSLVAQAPDETTPLERRLESLGRTLLWLTLAILIVVAGVGIARGHEVLLMIETAIALAVAAIPEGLPIVATIAMARGMLRMARHNALINRLAAVETLGSTTVVCTDKTGTLTENKMTVARIVLDEAEIVVRDEPRDGVCFFQGDAPFPPEDHETLVLLLEAGVLCNNASLGDGRNRKAVGDPLEIALLEAAAKAGLDRDNLAEHYPQRKQEPFDPSIKMMATFHETEDGVLLMVKGAPERVIAASARVQSREGPRRMSEDLRRQWNERNLRLAERGLRVLALATKTADSQDAKPYEDLTFLGLVGMVDPPRRGVAEAIHRCRDAGMKVVMVTGDHAATASSIARQVGLIENDDHQTIEGGRIKPVPELSDGERREFAQARVFARVSPQQKLHLIDFYKQAGQVVAMTGDGVNDAPALKKADIGIAMGIRGTQVAREAADMILKDDAFSSIVVAVEEGRGIFNNIRKFVVYLLSGNTSEILTVFIASLLNWPLPLLPLQILFLNIVNDVFPALALGLSRGGRQVMEQPPRNPKEPVLTQRHWWSLFGYGGLIAVPVLASFWIARTVLKAEPMEAVTVSFLTLAFARLWHIFNMRDPDSGLVRNEITANPYVWAALAVCSLVLLGAVYLPGISTVLDLHGPDPRGWATILALSLAPLLIGQLVKIAGGRKAASSESH
jgi:Ca2+-transporting ATPase